ncbi:MAG: hypothetical protein M1819_004928 [Sarea resinae]|nr:MAG: hypothetical protein M1819_004928 [Sarea resinae]
MSNPDRPSLKLKLNTGKAAPAAQPVSTPSTSTPKIKLKFGNAGSSKTPASAEPSKPASKAPKKPKAKSQKSTTANGAAPPKSSKKRTKDVANEDDEEVDSRSRPQIKKLKLTSARAPKTPIIRTRLKGKPPHRPLGVGYDSESSDREIDPAIEEQFVLRMPPGEDCDYMRSAIENKRVGIPLREGGADIRMKFLNREGRRAVVTIQGRHYAATMVDLPCVIEGMKSWDRRGWWKSADICQMLLVFARIKDEAEAATIPLPREVDEKTWQYPHGLTPPMHYVRKRRFRKRVSKRTIEAVEEEVERLLAMDRMCEPGGSKYEIVDLDRLTRDPSRAQSEDSEEAGGFNMLGNAGMQGSEFGDQDAEGDVDDGTGYFDIVAGDADGEVDGDGLEADLEMALMMDDENPEPSTADISTTTSNAAAAAAAATAAAMTSGAHPPSKTAATLASGAAGPMPSSTPTTSTATPAGAASSSDGDDSDDDNDSGNDDDDDDDDDDDAASVDEATLERQQELQRQKEEIADLEAAIKNQHAELERVQNGLLRTKLLRKIQSLKADLELKRSAIGMDGDEGEEGRS